MLGISPQDETIVAPDVPATVVLIMLTITTRPAMPNLASRCTVNVRNWDSCFTQAA
jgi:hypothetical protein